MTRPSRRALLAAALALTLSGCDGGPAKPSFRSIDVTNAPWGRDFSLTDHHGQRRALADFRGKVVTVFFGYTMCPDVCPTTLVEMVEVMKLLGKDADRIQVLFITVDPERDTPALLAQYVPAFDPRFLGLHGTPDEIDRVAKEFRVIHQRVAGSRPGFYTVDHTANNFVFDPQGRLRLVVKHGQGAAPLAEDIRKLLAGA
jgi:protein SCO1/2